MHYLFIMLVNLLSFLLPVTAYFYDIKILPPQITILNMTNLTFDY